MAVLFYQIGIFLAIIISATFGKKSRNTAVILISIFTILQVFMSWLLLLQFITIFIAYSFSNNIANSKTKKKSTLEKEKNTEKEFLNKNQEVEYSKLSRLHTNNILTSLKAPTSPYKPINPDKDKPNFSSRLIYITLFLVHDKNIIH